MRTQYPQPDPLPVCYQVYRYIGRMARPVIRRINTFKEKYDLGSLEAYLYGVIYAMQAPEGVCCDADIAFFSWFAKERPKKIEKALNNLRSHGIIAHIPNVAGKMCYVIITYVESPLDSILDVKVPEKKEGCTCCK